MNSSVQVFSKETVLALQGVEPSVLDSSWHSLKQQRHELISWDEFPIELARGLTFATEGTEAERDQINSILMLKFLPKLTVLLATDSRLWTTLAFRDLKDYVTSRHKPKSTTDEDLSTYFRNKFFISSSRGLMRDQAISRLWWMGHLACQIDENNPQQVLSIFLKTVDNASQFWGRPSISAAPNLTTAIYEVMVANNYATTRTKDNFSGFMIDIDKIAGRRVLAYLDPSELQDEIDALYLKHF